jgi:hypothetical protein
MSKFFNFFVPPQSRQMEFRPARIHSPDPFLRAGISLGRANPKPQKYCFALPSPFIRFVLLDFVQNSFELCPEHTANFEKWFRARKWGRHEVPTLMNSRQETLNPKEFAKENWAHRSPIQKYE